MAGALSGVRLLRLGTNIGEGRVIVFIELKDFDQPRDLEGAAHKRCGGDEADTAFVLTDPANRIDEDAERGAVQIGDFRQIDDDLVVFLLDQFPQRIAQDRAGMQVDFPFQMHEGDLIRRHLRVDFQIQNSDLPSDGLLYTARRAIGREVPQNYRTRFLPKDKRRLACQARFKKK